MAATTKTNKHRDFEREALPHTEILYNYALRMTNNAADADDLLASGETVVTDGQVRLTPGAKAVVKPPAEPAKADAGGAPAAQ